MDDEIAAAARHAQALALERGLIDAPLIDGGARGPAAPLAVRGYLGLVRAALEAGRVKRLELYVPACFTDVERRRARSAIDGGWIDAYRHGLAALDRFGGVACREIAYLGNLASAWRYRDDPDMVDVGRMCDVVSLYSELLYLYRELLPGDLGGWARADAACVARNRFLDQLDGGQARAAALEATRAEERDPDRFRVS